VLDHTSPSFMPEKRSLLVMAARSRVCMLEEKVGERRRVCRGCVRRRFVKCGQAGAGMREGEVWVGDWPVVKIQVSGDVDGTVMGCWAGGELV